MRHGLRDIRALDLSEGIAGAYCAHLLSDAGADVVKVEQPGGDVWRHWSASRRLKPDDGDGALFSFLHHGVRSVEDDTSGTHFAALVRNADIVIESGQMSESNIDSLRNNHPELVIVSVTPYGRSGPYAERPVTELIVQAESGTMLYRGSSEMVPFQQGGRVSEWISGTFAAVAATAALHGVSTTGRGDHIDLSMLEVMCIAGSAYMQFTHQLLGSPPIRFPCRSQETPSIEPTRDGYVGFCTNSRDQFDNFLVLIDRADLMADENWSRALYRRRHLAEWSELVHEKTREATTAEMIDGATALRVPVAPVNDGPGVTEFEQFRARGVFQADPTGSFVGPRRPWMMNGEPPPVPAPAPRLGEQTGLTDWAPRVRPMRPPIRRQTGRPLEGLRVVDMTAWWAGPMATGVLAALGADVVHIESVTRMDAMRTTGGSLTGTEGSWWERSPQFLCANTNKRGLTLDLTHPRGLEILKRLIRRSDVLVENFSPRVMDNFGLKWSNLKEINPRLVFVRMPAFGLSGPWSERVGFAQTMEQMTGMAWITGHADDQPRVQQGPADPNAGMHAAFALLVALAEREHTAEGVEVEATMVEGALNAAAEVVIEWSAYGERLQRNGNRSPNVAPQGLYRCMGDDEWLAISVDTDERWKALTGVLELSALESDPDLAEVEGRIRRQDELDSAIGRWTADRDVDAAADLLVNAGVPAARARDPRLLVDHPQLEARGFHESLAYQELGTLQTPSLPFRSANTGHWLTRPAPTLGQHNHEILVGELGLTEDEYDELVNEKVIGQQPVM
jgi:crotonobetainyl-CoA:carnitine CoA-transferase CaiB-like acyl-CoA transferase